MGSMGMATAPAARVTARCRHNSASNCRNGFSRGSRATTIRKMTSSAQQTPTKINKSRTMCSKKFKTSMTNTSLDALDQCLGGRRVGNLVTTDEVEKYIATAGPVL